MTNLIAGLSSPVTRGMLQPWRSDAQNLARRGGNGYVSDLVAILPDNFCIGGVRLDRGSRLDLVGNSRAQEGDPNTTTRMLIR